jgi:hypothetical protein
MKANLNVTLLLLACTARSLANVHYVDVNSTNAAPPFTSWATAATNIQDAVDAAVAGDEVVVTNGIYATGGRAVDSTMITRVAVDKPLALRSVNGPQVTVITGGGAGRCVYLTNWASLSGFTLTNGYGYAGGGVWCESLNAVVSNCVITGNQVLGYSVFGFDLWGVGGGAYGGTLNNCTVTGNSASFKAQTAWRPYHSYLARGGGAAYCALNRCTLSDNRADVTLLETFCFPNDDFTSEALAQGGGAFNCTVNSCTVAGNSARAYNVNWDATSQAEGGGAYSCTMNNCTLVGNSATAISRGPSSFSDEYGGGASECELNNCIAYYNSGYVQYIEIGENDAAFCTLNYCWLPDGDIANAPVFVDTNRWANLRLQSNSPCINAGKNAYVLGATDLGGNPRIAGGTVDIGAYEFQTPASRISYAWLQQYGLPITANTDGADPDEDGMDNWQEWLCQTDPTNALSALRLLAPIATSTRSVNLRTSAAFTPLATNVFGAPSTTTFTDTNAVGSGPFFYRVGVGD